MNRPDPILTDGSNPFAYRTVATRLTAMLGAIPATGPARTRLDELQRGIEADTPLTMFTLPAPDYEWWHERFFAHAARIRAATGRPPSPHNAEWFFFEHYLYRLVIEAVDWWGSGVDPFADVKQQELDAPAIWSRISAVLRTTATAGNPLDAYMRFCLWGNQVDLSYSEVAEAAERTPDDGNIIANDFEHARPLLKASDIHVVCDNAGTELAADLALADYLLNYTSRTVVLHVKFHPTYVSDTVPSDVHSLVGAMKERSEPDIASLGERLGENISNRTLRIVPDPYWNGPDFLDALPERLEQTFSSADLVIIKGDMNYRRLVGDSVPAATTPLSDVSVHVPAPALLVRTMKGDPVAGLTEETLKRLESEDPQWRVNGRRGVIQLI